MECVVASDNILAGRIRDGCKLCYINNILRYMYVVIGHLVTGWWR